MRPLLKYFLAFAFTAFGFSSAQASSFQDLFSESKQETEVLTPKHIVPGRVCLEAQKAVKDFLTPGGGFIFFPDCKINPDDYFISTTADRQTYYVVSTVYVLKSDGVFPKFSFAVKMFSISDSSFIVDQIELSQPVAAFR